MAVRSIYGCWLKPFDCQLSIDHRLVWPLILLIDFRTIPQEGRGPVEPMQLLMTTLPLPRLMTHPPKQNRLQLNNLQLLMTTLPLPRLMIHPPKQNRLQ